MPVATLVVVPTFNEAENIAELVHAVRAHLPAAHLLVVDDASPDGTAAIARQLAGKDDQVHLLERTSKLGIGSAYVAGFGWGLERGYERFFEMDADLSHDPKALPAFVAALEGGAEVVVGSRRVAGGGVRGWGPLRHALSMGGSLYSRLMLDSPVRDMTSGYKGYTRRALEVIGPATLRSNGYAFQVETTHRALLNGLRVVEIPILFVDRRAGHSKMSSHEVGEAAIAVWRMRCRAIAGSDGFESSTYSQARTRSRCKREGRSTRSRR
jgi:dolichol-phosphate mannosyltransferase